MLTRLKRLLGWEAPSSPRRSPSKARPVTASAKPGRGNARAAATAAHRKPPPARPTAERDVAAILDNPSLSLDTGEEQEGFDPYSTGVFDRGASWDRISKNNR